MHLTPPTNPINVSDIVDKNSGNEIQIMQEIRVKIKESKKK